MTLSRLPSDFQSVFFDFDFPLHSYCFSIVLLLSTAMRVSECWPATWPVVATIFKDDANCNLTPM